MSKERQGEMQRTWTSMNLIMVDRAGAVTLNCAGQTPARGQYMIGANFTRTQTIAFWKNQKIYNEKP